MNCNDANLNLVSGSENQKSLTIKFLCQTKARTCFSVKIEHGDIDENYMLEQLIDLLYESEVLFCCNNPNQWEYGCRVIYKGSNAVLSGKPRIWELFKGDTSPIVTFIGTNVNDSSYFGKTITFKDLINIKQQISRGNYQRKRINIERLPMDSDRLDIKITDLNSNEFHMYVGNDFKSTDFTIIHWLHKVNILCPDERINSPWVGQTIEKDELTWLLRRRDRQDKCHDFYTFCSVTNADSWRFTIQNSLNRTLIDLSISRNDFDTNCSTWQSVINVLRDTKILGDDEVAYLGQISQRGIEELGQPIIAMLIHAGLIKLSESKVRYDGDAKKMTFREVLALYNKTKSQKLLQQTTDETQDKNLKDKSNFDDNHDKNSQESTPVLNTELLKTNKLIPCEKQNINLKNEITANKPEDENGDINHNLNKVVKPNSEELKNNDANKVVDNLKETFSQTESKKNKINEIILFSCRKKGIMTESFSLEINCDDIDNNLLFKDFIKELVAKGVFYCSSNKVSDHYKAIYCNGVPASELTVGEVLKLPAVSVQNKFIVGMPWLHINGAYVNKTAKLEDVIKSHVQVESQERLNKRSLEQPKLESTLLKDNLDEGKKEDEADKNVKDKNSLLIPFRCGSEKEQQIFNLELEDDDIKHDYQLQELIKILIDAKILTWSKMNWQLDCHISCRGYSLADKSVNEALKLLKNEMSPFCLLQTQIGSDYNNQTVKLKDVIKLRNKIKTQQQISNEKQDKQDNINIDNSNSNVNLLGSYRDKKNRTMTIQARKQKEGQNFAKFSIEFEHGDIDDRYAVKQLIDLLHEAKIFIRKQESGLKGDNYSSHDAREVQKSISEVFSSYKVPKITLLESVFHDSNYFDKKMTFKNLIKLGDDLKSEELKKQGYLSEKLAQPKIDKIESETLVGENNVSDLLQNDNSKHGKNSKDALILKKQKEQLQYENEVDQQTNENNATGLFSKDNEYQEKVLVDKNIDGVLKLKLGTKPNNRNIKMECFAMKKNSKFDKMQWCIFEEGNSFYIKFDALLIAIKKALKIEDTSRVKSIDVWYGAHMCKSYFGQRGFNGIYFDSTCNENDIRFTSLLNVDVEQNKNKLLCFKTFIGGQNCSGCKNNSCASFYRVGFKIRVNADNNSETIYFASFPDGNKGEDFSSVSLYHVNEVGDTSACDADNKILIYQNKDVTKGAVTVTGNTISECPNLEIIDSDGIELESEVGMADSDINSNHQSMEEQHQTSEDLEDEVCKQSLRIELWFSQEVDDGFTLEIEPDDINVETPLLELELLINALGAYKADPDGPNKLLKYLYWPLVSAKILDKFPSGISRYDSYTFENWNDKSLKQKFKALVDKGTHTISAYGAKLNDKGYCGKTIKFQEVLNSQLMQLRLEVLNSQSMQLRLEVLNSQLMQLRLKESENGETQQQQAKIDSSAAPTGIEMSLSTEKNKKHSTFSRFLFFIKNNDARIITSVFFSVAGILIGFGVGWIFAPILPIANVVLILLDLKFNFLKPTKISEDLATHIDSEETDFKNIRHREQPRQEDFNPDKSNTFHPY